MKLKLIYDRRSVGQSVLVSDSHLEPMTRFLFSDDFGFLDVGHCLWREVGPVIYLCNCFWALPAHWLLGWSPAELTTLFYRLIWDSPSLEFSFTRIRWHLTIFVIWNCRMAYWRVLYGLANRVTSMLIISMELSTYSILSPVFPVKLNYKMVWPLWKDT
jgi:hypothetical protein